jgi:hypothetical protein
VIGQPEKVLICRGGQAEGKNVQKMQFLLPLWTSAETILLRPGQRVGLNLLRGVKGINAFKAAIKNFFKIVYGPLVKVKGMH